MTASLRRMYALFLRQVFVIRRSPPRVAMYIFWPTFNMTIWGFMNRYLVDGVGAQNFVMATLLGAALIFAFNERTQLNVMVGFLEEIWARNIGNILITPVRSYELIAGFLINGTIGSFLGIGIAMIICIALFGFNLFSLGWPLLAFIFCLLMTGWWAGMVLISVVIRYGTSGEYIAWMIPYVMIPFMGVYYPISVLPGWAKAIGLALPPTYIFESLRGFLKTHQFDWHNFTISLVLNSFYLLLSCLAFAWQLKKARQRGGLLAMGE